MGEKGLGSGRGVRWKGMWKEGRNSGNGGGRAKRRRGGKWKRRGGEEREW